MLLRISEILNYCNLFNLFQIEGGEKLWVFGVGYGNGFLIQMMEKQMSDDTVFWKAIGLVASQDN